MYFGVTKENYIWKKKDFDEVILHDFEYLKIPIPKNYHDILQKQYGNYMVFERGTSCHGQLIFDTDISYKDYVYKK